MQVTFAGPMSPRDAALCARFAVPATTVEGACHLRRLGDSLRLEAPGGEFAVTLDLREGPLAHRLRTARKSEPLPRAVGLTRRSVSVFDCTAGLGRDALVLAHLGCKVVAVEQIGALAMLLADAVEGTPLAERLQVVHGDALATLAGLADAQRPDVVYLDPMFPAHGKAQVKKDAQLLRLVVGPAADPAPLFARALAVARDRVVVKRSSGSPPLADADFRVAGGPVRFDVHLVSRR